MSREMKESGVAWLKQIPVEWEIVYPKALFGLRKEKAKADDRQLTASQQYGVIYQEDYMELTGSRVVVVEKDFDILKHVEKGDFVISMRSFQGGLEYSENSGSISSAYVMLIPNLDYVIPEYYKWALKSPTYITALQSTSNLVREGQAMRYTNFVQVPLCIIPKDEQIRIADKLNGECEKIDALISNQQKQIEKLKTYKQSLITEAVTKGLNPDAEMKDSGVEWIGEIPKEWNVAKVSSFYEIVLGKMLQPQPNTGDTLEQYLCAANVGGNKLNLNVTKEMYFSRKDKEMYDLKYGDLVVVEGGDVASSAIIEFDAKNLFFQNALHRVRAKKGENAFLRYWLIFAKGIGYFDIICNKATIAHFTKDKFKSMPMVIMTEAEQQKIVKYLDEKCSQIDSLISIKQQKIEKLNEYKKSIIYEYVTGKKEA